MSRSESVLSRYEMLLAAATVAAHSTAGSGGFRQKDIKFLFDLFANWIENCFKGGIPPLRNTHVLRYVQELHRDGYLRQLSRKNRPLYRLTRLGLIELISRMSRGEILQREQFFFLFNFIKNYKPLIFSLVQAEDNKFPHSLQIELEALLDQSALLDAEMARVEKAIKKLEVRIHDSLASSELCTTRLRQNVSFPDIVKESEKKYPYDLNSQKPLSDLIESIVPEQRQWELQVGNRRRAEELWTPMRHMLRAYLAELKKLPRI